MQAARSSATLCRPWIMGIVHASSPEKEGTMGLGVGGLEGYAHCDRRPIIWVDGQGLCCESSAMWACDGRGRVSGRGVSDRLAIRHDNGQRVWACIGTLLGGGHYDRVLGNNNTHTLR